MDFYSHNYQKTAVRYSSIFSLILFPLIILMTLITGQNSLKIRGEEKGNPTAPIPITHSAQAMKAPPGMKVTLFAGEPAIVQPIAFTFDDRGRMWVIESMSYPHWVKGDKGKDRIVILEDTDGDGIHDKRTIFWDEGANLTGIAYGHGGIWLTATPKLLFIPIDPSKDKPIGPAKVILDGWSIDARHNVFNSLLWGPDGWLYGCNGILSQSSVGKPGTPAHLRIKIDCGVWRYHPYRETFELVASGSTNPWGIDYDDFGEMFITNCVIHHLWHVIPGSHFQRMFGQDLNAHTYELMSSCADHIHWGGGDWTTSRGGKGIHDNPGGGHAHSGCMIYLSDQLGKQYRNGVFMCNIHGNRINHDQLERTARGYVAHHDQDFLFANDPWFRGIAIHSGPDGSIYVSDWCDTGECHNYEIVDQTNGRIYKISPQKHEKHPPIRLHEKTDLELAQLQFDKNDWLVRQSRRILAERTHLAGLDRTNHKKIDPLVKPMLSAAIINKDYTIPQRLRALWCLYAINEFSLPPLAILSQYPAEIRSWYVRLALDRSTCSDNDFTLLTELLKKETSANQPTETVLTTFISCLQRLSIDRCYHWAELINQRGVHTLSHNVQLLYWYGLERLPEKDLKRATALLFHSTSPLIQTFLTRRLLTLPGQTENLLDSLVAYLDEMKTPSTSFLPILRGMQLALEGRKKIPMPKHWLALFEKLQSLSDLEIQQLSILLSSQFGDLKILDKIRHILLNRNAPVSLRRTAIQAAFQANDPSLRDQLLTLIHDQKIQAIVIRALANYDDPRISTQLVELYPKVADSLKEDILQTLSSRLSYAKVLLQAMDKGIIPTQKVPVLIIRQILQLKGSNQLQKEITRIWGQIQPADKNRSQKISAFKKILSPEKIANADLRLGRLLFENNCASCHRLFDQGKQIGPELTGSQRTNLDYILENVLFPSAVVAREYRVHIIQRLDGRVIQGILIQETPIAIRIQTPNELITIPKEDIESRKESAISMMPEGLLDKLNEREIANLVQYLASPAQVPLPPQKDIQPVNPKVLPRPSR